jgi:hypothetical protein
MYRSARYGTAALLLMAALPRLGAANSMPPGDKGLWEHID